MALGYPEMFLGYPEIAPVHILRPVVHTMESIVYTIEAIVHTMESIVHTIECIVYTIVAIVYTILSIVGKEIGQATIIPRSLRSWRPMSLSLNFWILPLPVRGYSLTKNMYRGILCRAICPRQ